MIGRLVTLGRKRTFSDGFFSELASASPTLIIVGLSLCVVPAQGETLAAAMHGAYRSNPALKAERLKVRAVDEGVAVALSGWRPRVTGEARYGYKWDDRTSQSTTNDRDRTWGYGLNIEQPIFDGFQTEHAVAEAETNVAASRQDLKSFENELLFQVASSYLDVLRDEGIVLYRRRSLTALQREVIGVRERLDRGQVTATDLEQSKLRASRAKSDLDEAEGNLRVSQLRFSRLRGREPRDLIMPSFPGGHIPKSLQSAITRAEAESPIVAAAMLKTTAAHHAVSRVRGELLPNITLAAGYDRSVNDNTFMPDQDAFSIVGRLRVPLYQGGAVAARIRQGASTAARLDLEGHDTRARISEAVRASWATLDATRERLSADEAAVASGERALEGVREEERLGRRTVLDVLDAERELVEARIRLLRTTRDRHVSAYALIRSVGGLTLQDFVPGSELYEPEAHYREVRAKWWGTAVTPAGNGVFLGTATDDGVHQSGRAGGKTGGWSLRRRIAQ